MKVLVETKVLEKDWVKARYEKLALIDEKRVRAQYHAQEYQKRIARAFNKKVKQETLKKGTWSKMCLEMRLFTQEGR